MATRVEGFSKGEINRAGDLLRSLLRGEQTKISAFELSDMYGCLIAFRTSFQLPLKKVVMGLRSFVKTEMADHPPDGKLPVGQRLKREPQIERKLVRFPDMKLARMQDIGGCRAILPGGADEVKRVHARIKKRWGPTIKGGKDYVAEPAPTGYRGIHVVVLRDDHLIEIQLRTPGQHEWARAIERTELRTRYPLKDGEGPTELLQYFVMASDGIALQEAGSTPDEDWWVEFRELREQVQPYFERKDDG